MCVKVRNRGAMVDKANCRFVFPFKLFSFCSPLLHTVLPVIYIILLKYKVL